MGTLRKTEAAASAVNILHLPVRLFFLLTDSFPCRGETISADKERNVEIISCFRFRATAACGRMYFIQF